MIIELLNALQSLRLPESLLLVVAFVFGIYVIARMLAESYDQVAKVLGPWGRQWAARRDERTKRAGRYDDLVDKVKRRDAAMDRMQSEIDFLRQARVDDKWNADLNRQVKALDIVVRELRERGEITDGYLRYDHQWHRQHQLSDDPINRHISFLEFESRWRAGDPDVQGRDLHPDVLGSGTVPETNTTARSATDQED